MAKYKAYPEYKDSGVEWLGELPAHWTTLAIKHVAQLNPSKSCISIEKMKGMCSFIPMEKLKFNSLCLDEIKDVTDVYNGYTYFENEDILIAKVTPCFENKNMVVARDLNNGVGFGSSEIYVLRCNDIINNDFLFYRLQEDSFMFIAEGAMTGAGGLKRVPSEVLNNFKFGLPSKKEQSIIVDFLKHETAKIDNLIEKQQQLIELLKEKRQSVISHAVTKGLNPDVPMKDSGVEWLGEVPDHWELVPLKYLCNFSGGGTPTKDNLSYWQGGTVPWVSPKDMKSFWISETQDYVTPKAVSESSTNYIEEGSLLMVVRSGILQRNIPVAINIVKVTMNQDMKALRFNERMKAHYAAYFINGNVNSLLLEWTKEGATVESIEHEYLANGLIPVPPIDEQHSIIKSISGQMIRFELLEEKALTGILLLQERRTALISAAVTGKIDVRDWVAPDAQDVEASQEATA
ncbi:MULTISPECIES: restriction endonuclease subunit S [Enterobacteriaceae]|uniref:restriction endonuclease subunit S n=1 Tax=Enterobacteriaceae TaxID=543 RepID=UPI0007915E57|nr:MULTISPECIES: restriction endonuclease subunit S [Enterobacteriaceae]AXF61932.1 restriction endonuclease subunit S [Leclercia sp. W6]CZU57212.1 restriction modification system DNA specificity domain-containing protein [Enterobacter hormaechei]CZW79552.1 restriction modification system DNA specificity domain-containing protein [Enterobacter hormaechei]